MNSQKYKISEKYIILNINYYLIYRKVLKYFVNIDQYIQQF